MGLRIDGSVIFYLVDFLTLSSNLSNSIFFRILELLNKLVHDIDEDDLERGILAGFTVSEDEMYLISIHVQLLGYEATSNITSTEVYSFTCHGVRSCVRML